MATSKRPNTKHRKGYPIFIEVGLIAALLLLILAFRWEYSPPPPARHDLPQERSPVFVDVLQTAHKQPPPPRPPAPVEVSNDAQIEDEIFRIDVTVDFEEPLPTLAPPTHDEEKPDEPEPETIFVAVEQMPNLIGGLGAIQQAINYPEMARRADVSGRVTIQFVVDEEGNVQDAVVLKGIGAGCDEEALRVVRQAQFKPGKQRGKAVKVKMSLPITFHLH